MCRSQIGCVDLGLSEYLESFADSPYTPSFALKMRCVSKKKWQLGNVSLPFPRLVEKESTAMGNDR